MEEAIKDFKKYIEIGKKPINRIAKAIITTLEQSMKKK